MYIIVTKILLQFIKILYLTYFIISVTENSHSVSGLNSKQAPKLIMIA